MEHGSSHFIVEMYTGIKMMGGTAYRQHDLALNCLALTWHIHTNPILDCTCWYLLHVSQKAATYTPHKSPHKSPDRSPHRSPHRSSCLGSWSLPADPTGTIWQHLAPVPDVALGSPLAAMYCLRDRDLTAWFEGFNWLLHCSIGINLSFGAKVQEKQRKLGPTSTSTPGFCQVAWASEKKGKQTKLLQSWARTWRMKWRSGITFPNVAAIHTT